MGNVQISFWSRRKSLGRLFHETSRAAGDVLLSLGGRVDCAGLSGSPPPVPCADANSGAKERLRQEKIGRHDCLFMRLIRLSWMRFSGPGMPPCLISGLYSAA